MNLPRVIYTEEQSKNYESKVRVVREETGEWFEDIQFSNNNSIHLNTSNISNPILQGNINLNNSIKKFLFNVMNY